MKHFLRSAATLALILGITAASFAGIEPNTALGPVGTMEKRTATLGPVYSMDKRTKTRKQRRSNRRVTNIPYTGRNSVIRVRRLSARERRDVFRRLIDIRIN